MNAESIKAKLKKEAVKYKKDFNFLILDLMMLLFLMQLIWYILHF